jgi:UDP-N-acetylglucosamine 2-epimerase (non-hydrolysing)
MALNADFVITDSGGLQIETSVLGVPCATLRTETEHTETLTYGTNRLIAPDRIDLTSTLVSFYNQALTARGRRGIPPHEPSVVTRISEALRTWFKV